MTDPEIDFELNETGEITKITINSSGSGWDEILKGINEYARQCLGDKIQEIKYNVVKELIKDDLKDDRRTKRNL